MRRMLTRTMIIITTCAILVFTLFAVFSIRWTSIALQRAIEERTYYEAAKCANQISTVFENAKGAVDTLYSYVHSTFNIASFDSNSSYINNYMKEIAPTLKTALLYVKDTNGLYVTFDPSFTNYSGAYEVWYVIDEAGNIKPVDATVNGKFLEAFKEYNAPNMQYYFKAVQNNGKGVWVDPSYDPDLEVDTLSYAKAIIIGGRLIGVVGADILTEHTTDIIKKMHVDNDGEVYLLNEQKNLIISSDENSKIESIAGDKFWGNVHSHMEMQNEGTFTVNAGKEVMQISFSKLSNKWTLAILTEQDKLYAPIKTVKMIIVSMAAILAILTVVVAYLALMRFSNPIKKAADLLKLMDLESEIEDTEKQSIQSEDDIEALVKKHIEKQRYKDIIMAHQSRLAQAGEMMTNITHQWKQPLNNINIVMGNLRDDAVYGEINKEKIYMAISKTEKLVKAMTMTIDDFSKYLKPEIEQESFSVNETIKATLTIMEDRFKASDVNVNFEVHEIFFAYGYKNALYHVLINVITNAIDAINEGDKKEGEIVITVRRDSENPGRILIELFNNGIKMDKDVEEHLFVPYFTTKDDHGGTGIGLCISKNLLQKSMGGTINLENVSDGVKCTISILAGGLQNGQ